MAKQHAVTDILRQYHPVPDRFDELGSMGSGPKSHWRPLLQQLNLESVDSLNIRAQAVSNAIAEDGVTYNVYEDPRGDSRPWEVDLLPLILGADEWQWLSKAVAQRAELLDSVLADLYGEQSLLKEGLMPPALVYGQAGFQWPCQGIEPADGRFLHLYAVDLARAPDGGWWVMADRTQAPSGAGYALQNRLVISRAFPAPFHNLPVTNLSEFFQGFQNSLAGMSPAGTESPLCVLLTPGRFNETYFEHVFLARYLGLPLVEGQDLTVRDDTVYLKTLQGLRRVHAIYRRLDDGFCDPLELRADSVLGIPGLLGAVRAGKVLMANALGSGVLESAALFGFLPEISKKLLGSPLAMPSVASWWCGEKPALDYVIEHLDELVIKPAFASMRMEPVFGYQVRGAERDALIKKMHAHPHAFVGQELVHLSQAPVWKGERDQPLATRSIGLRLFAAATPSGWRVMPGGLTRVAMDEGVEVISMQRGGLSKDTWVQARYTAPSKSLIKKRLQVSDLLDGERDTPSRVGENLFWMGRHSERAEATARLLRAAFNRLSGHDQASEEALLGLQQAAEQFGTLPEPEEDAVPEPLPGMLLRAVSDLKFPGSIASILQALLFNASQVRDRLSSDNWHTLNRVGKPLSPAPTTPDQSIRALNLVLLDCISLAGFAMDDITRDASWVFLVIGRRLERLANLCTLICVPLFSDRFSRHAMLEWLLEVANSEVTYRTRYRRTPELLGVVHTLVIDASNPHSVMFQLRQLQKDLPEMGRKTGQLFPPDLNESLQRLQALDLHPFERKRPDKACEALAELLCDIRSEVYRVSDEIQRQCFIHTRYSDRPMTPD
ncbi:molybdopterin oxidoreductase [Marinobacter sp. EhC06]|uniref:circularly permuted type 2 ATP-grasp protein n=2 Tax=Marinobacteraceae TaxID=2887365 RepID=UPI0007D97FE5|nr:MULTISPECIES: circularly permuted type 2 ATP-grasp protein [unclassified Marinobacter]OAN88514.1 molybdopterin oxidoreductase [Marinobacter sp. EhN04]OAN91496.1 molybdopterin oxidoreductase [Marinobacter sp. EhC06]